MGRRLKILRVAPELLLPFLGLYEQVNTDVHVLNLLPTDVKIVGAQFDTYREVVVFKLESKTFPEVPEGDLIPHIDPQPMFLTSAPSGMEPTPKGAEMLRAASRSLQCR